MCCLWILWEIPLLSAHFDRFVLGQQFFDHSDSEKKFVIWNYIFLMEKSSIISMELYSFFLPQEMWMHKWCVCFWAHCGAKHLAWRPNIPIEFLCDPIPFGWHCPTLFQLWNFQHSRNTQRTNTIKLHKSWISCWFWVFHCFFPKLDFNSIFVY